RTKGDNSVFVLPKEIEKIKAFLSQNEEFKDNAFLPQNEEFKDNAFLPQNGEFKDLIVSESDFVLPLFPDYYLENPENETISICFDTFLDILNFLKDQIDEVGRIHTFGRMLRRKENGACFFLDESTKKCKIYEVRPGLCRTYPFYPDGAGILECECCGFGSAAKTNISLTAELTDALEKRLFVELVDFKKTQFFLKEMAAQFQLNTDDGIKKAISNLHEGFLKFVIYDGSGVFEADVSLW
ncbi:MAG: YkgJ family cysteine cluster protein, partial [Methanimicrococcus sp.]|nr:YkgJ family cysteine cluster protein [Methanimicrococcus sp.]